MNRLGFIATTVLVALALASSMLFVVDQRQFGILYALVQIKEVIVGLVTVVQRTAVARIEVSYNVYAIARVVNK